MLRIIRARISCTNVVKILPVAVRSGGLSWLAVVNDLLNPQQHVFVLSSPLYSVFTTLAALYVKGFCMWLFYYKFNSLLDCHLDRFLLCFRHFYLALMFYVSLVCLITQKGQLFKFQIHVFYWGFSHSKSSHLHLIFSPQQWVCVV